MDIYKLWFSGKCFLCLRAHKKTWNGLRNVYHCFTHKTPEKFSDMYLVKYVRHKRAMIRVLLYILMYILAVLAKNGANRRKKKVPQRMERKYAFWCCFCCVFVHLFPFVIWWYKTHSSSCECDLAVDFPLRFFRTLFSKHLSRTLEVIRTGSRENIVFN